MKTLVKAHNHCVSKQCEKVKEIKGKFGLKRRNNLALIFPA